MEEEKEEEKLQAPATAAEVYRAVAMQYDEEQEVAPRVTAKGEGEMAERIVDLAEESGVPLYRDEDLVELLYNLDLEQQIPVSLYEAVAEVFAFLYRMNSEEKKREE